MNMRDLISQAELDALLESSTGAVVGGLVERLSARGDVQPFDIQRLEHIDRGRMPTLELVNERFTRQLRVGLLDFLGQSPAVSLGTVTVQKYSEFTSELALPSRCSVVAIHPLHGNAMIACDPALVFTVIDMLFGGTGNLAPPDDGRVLSVTEHRTIKRLVSVIADEYTHAWSGICPLEFIPVRFGVQPRFANVAAPGERVITTAFELEIGGNTGLLHVCLPYVAMEPIRDILSAGTQADFTHADARWSSLLASEIQAVDITLVAELAVLNSTVADVLAMKVGDFIGLKVEPQITVSVEGVPLFACQHGTTNAQYAIRIDGNIGRHGVTPDDSDPTGTDHDI
jgi:flagellar motor switch protein FliM